MEKEGKIIIMAKEYPNQAVQNAIAPTGGSVASPSPCSELPPPASSSRFVAWHVAIWYGDIPLDCVALLPDSFFLFHGKISFQNNLDYFFHFFKIVYCVAPCSDVNQVFLMFILFHCSLDWSMGGDRAVSTPGAVNCRYLPFWVLEAPSPEVVSAKHTQSLGQSL